MLGNEVTVNGQATLRLLPLPAVSFEDVVVGDQDKPIATAKQFYFNIEIAPLLKTEIVVADMIVSQLNVTTKIQKNGQVVWGEIQKIPVNDVRLDAIQLEDATININDQRFQKNITVSNINANANAQSLSGPWTLNGTAMWGGRVFEVDVQTGKFGKKEDGTDRISVKVETKTQDVPFEFKVEGEVVANDVPHFSGQFEVRPIVDEEQVKPEYHIEADGVIGLSASGLVVSEYQARIGEEDPYRIKGNAFANFGQQFRIHANGEQILLDRIEQVEAKNLSQRIQALKNVLEAIPVPSTKGTVLVNLPAIVADDTIIRDVAIEAEPTKTGWYLADLKAELPGRTTIIANGNVSLGGAFGYQGDLIVASQQPTGLAKWLRQSVPDAIANISTAGFHANTVINQDGIRLSDMELVLDGEQFVGEFERKPSPNRGLIKAKFNGGKLNLDQLTGLVTLLTGDDITNPKNVTDHDIALNLDVSELTFAGVSANGVKTEFDYHAGTLALNRLEIQDINGTKVEVSGRVNNKDTVSGSLSGNVSVGNPAEILKLIQKKLGPFPVVQRFIDEPYLLADSDIGFRWKKQSQEEPTQINLLGFVGTSALDANIKISGETIRADVGLNNNDTAFMLMQVGMPVIEVSGTRNGKIQTSVEGDNLGGYDVRAEVKTETLNANVNGRVQTRTEEDNIYVSGNLNVEASATDIDPLILMFAIPLPQFGEGLPAGANAKLKLDEQKIRVGNANINIGETQWEGDVTIDLNKKPKPFVSGEVSVDTISSDMILGLVFPNNEPLPIMSGLDGELKFGVGEVVLDDGDSVVSGLESILTIQDGDLGFGDVNAQWLGGRLGGEINLAKGNNKKLISGQMSLKNADLSRITKIAGFQNGGINGKTDINLGFEASENQNSMMKGLTGNGVINIQNGSVGGLNSEALIKSVIKRFDERDSDKGDVDYGELSSAGLFDGEFAFNETQTEFLVAAGVVRVNGTKLLDENMSVSVDAKMNLTEDGGQDEHPIVADLAFEFDPQREKIIGAAPEFSAKLFGTTDNINAEFNLAPLNTFLGMRAAERREREFEAQKVAILERQRLTRQTQLYQLKIQQTQKQKTFYERLADARMSQQNAEWRFIQKREEETQKQKEEEAKKIAEEVIDFITDENNKPQTNTE